ncbi:hypothetical protein [Enterovibrio nigricans]|uniref:Uncharacterized protein n=1 Tax=Enterovibrio nigricans DSM 22720 TaxID=1121868 RepID=A0A1T4TXK7_9GAMM|nr:hypothetical protein [Enterovibrio nigricans]PKF49507.1 hypothetical protein AT251_18340 [Enterovibrio nigricans]SKA45212.1 hypothetical protein SAMN02745132_00317 [Enterovibrio nigricans DSM 22720]
MEKIVLSRCFLQAKATEGSNIDEINSPDVFPLSLGNDIPDDFVLCRDKENVVTAYYSSMEWDFKPYRLSAAGNCKMSFGSLVGIDNREKDIRLINEVKQILFCLIYHVRSGANGYLSITTLMHYYQNTMHAARFCIDSGANRLLGRLSLSEFFRINCIWLLMLKP